MLFSKKFAESLFSAYDLRSVEFTIQNAFDLGKSFGSEIILLNKTNVCVGHDRRLLSEQLYDNFIEGLISVGIDVFYLGQVGTPVIQYTSVKMKLDAAVSITASHNPVEYHGFKFFVDNLAFSGKSLYKLIIRCLDQNFYSSKSGCKKKIDKDLYIEFMNSILIKGKFNIGWDLLNGCGGDTLPFISLNGVNKILNSEKKEDFGGYAPDPNCFTRLSEIKFLEKSDKIDFAFLIDGDADRTSLLFKNNIIPGDVFLSMIIYLEWFINKEKISVIWDDISSLSIKKWASQFSESFISKTGHSNIQDLAIEKNAFIAGECSGHYMFKEMHYIDDGIYSSLRFIEYLEKSNLSLDDLIKIVPKIFIEKCKTIYCFDHFQKIQKMDDIKHYLKISKINYSEFDGIKIFLESGCLIIRSSNTEPVIKILAEGWDKDSLIHVLNFYTHIDQAF